MSVFRYAFARRLFVLASLGFLLAPVVLAQNNAATEEIAARPTVVGSAAAENSVPRLVQFNGILKDGAARVVAGPASVTFAIYAEQEGGAAIWSETQNVLADANGHYSAVLGAATSGGFPAELFGTGESRWLGVAVARQAEMPRALLASVPYALKAGDAQTLGGLPASSYVTTQQLAARGVLAAPSTTNVIAAGGATSPSVNAAAGAGLSQDAPGTDGVAQSVTQAAVTGTGTANYLPLWTSGSNLGVSKIYQASGGFIGINTTTPLLQLDVNGNSIFRGSFQMAPQGVATASAGQPSHSFQWQGSVYDSSKKAAVNEAFGFRTVPAVNDSADPTVTLDLFYGPGGGTLADTGLSIDRNGIIKFAAGQDLAASALNIGANTTSAISTTNGEDGLEVQSAAPNAIYAYSSLGTDSATAIYGEAAGTDGTGVTGVGNLYGVAGVGPQASSIGGYFIGGAEAESGGTGVYAGGHIGISAQSSDNTSGAMAGVFSGNVEITGNVSKAGGSFRIDDPIDPSGKYLSHSFVESPDMKNVYDGVVTTDGSGYATVTMPAWFERAQSRLPLPTHRHRPVRAGRISSEMADNRFTIHTDQPRRESVVASDRHPPGRMGQCASHPGGRRENRQRAGTLSASRALRQAQRSEHRRRKPEHAPSATRPAQPGFGGRVEHEGTEVAETSESRFRVPHLDGRCAAPAGSLAQNHFPGETTYGHKTRVRRLRCNRSHAARSTCSRSSNRRSACENREQCMPSMPCRGWCSSMAR